MNLLQACLFFQPGSQHDITSPGSSPVEQRKQRAAPEYIQICSIRMGSISVQQAGFLRIMLPQQAVDFISVD
jgi:hypothetical protein